MLLTMRVSDDLVNLERLVKLANLTRLSSQQIVLPQHIQESAAEVESFLEQQLSCPEVCPNCGEKTLYSSESSLHNPIKQFACLRCGYSFEERQSQKPHRKKQHSHGLERNEKASSFWDRADRTVVIIAGGAAIGAAVAQIPGSIAGAILAVMYGTYISYTERVR